MVITGLDGLVQKTAALEQLSDISTWAEGPAWLPARRAVRWSDIIGNRILEWSWDSGETTVYRSDVEFTNGRTLDRDGSVLQCSHGLRRVERERDGAVTNVVDSWNGVRFNSPNDLVVGPDGAIWFTDPDYGLTQPGEGHPGDLEYDDHYVFRFDPGSGDLRPVVLDAGQPNGLAFSPGGDVLYVADSSESAVIRAYDVTDGHRCKNSRVFVKPDPGVPDGIRVDEHGNVWTSSDTGVIVYTDRGERLGSIEVPERTANLCWGGPEGRTLFVTATTSLYRIETSTRDAHLPR
jgi:gluconolactonase